MTASEVQSWVTIVGGVVAAVGVFIASFKALVEWRRANEWREEELRQRQREFRHKQATFARELTREVFADPRARAALKMLDSLSYEYADEAGVKHRVRVDQIQPALRTVELTFSDEEKFIRSGFEGLYEYLEQIEQLIGLEVVNFEDIETVFRYYMARALRPDVRHLGFLEQYDYPRAKKFLLRFEARPGGEGAK
jgi:hypothetical protein